MTGVSQCNAVQRLPAPTKDKVIRCVIRWIRPRLVIPLQADALHHPQRSPPRRRLPDSLSTIRSLPLSRPRAGRALRGTRNDNGLRGFCWSNSKAPDDRWRRAGIAHPFWTFEPLKYLSRLVSPYSCMTQNASPSHRFVFRPVVFGLPPLVAALKFGRTDRDSATCTCRPKSKWCNVYFPHTPASSSRAKWMLVFVRSPPSPKPQPRLVSYI